MGEKIEIIEIIGTLVFAIILASLITVFIFEVDYQEIQKSVNNIIMPNNETNYQKELNYQQFLKKINDCWTKCDTNDNIDCGFFTLTETNLQEDQKINGLSSAFINNTFEQLNFCTDCNVIIINDLNLKINSIAKMDCNKTNNTKVIQIRTN